MVVWMLMIWSSGESAAVGAGVLSDSVVRGVLEVLEVPRDSRPRCRISSMLRRQQLEVRSEPVRVASV